VSFSSDREIEVFPQFFEILGHGAGEVRLKRFESGNSPVLWNHDRSRQVGRITGVEVRDGRGHAEIQISRNETRLLSDIEDGIVRNTSVGYKIHNERLEEQETGEGGNRIVSRVTDWSPIEISFAPVAADDSTGLGRSEEETEARTRYIESLCANVLTSIRSGETEDADKNEPEIEMAKEPTATPTATITLDEADKQRADAVQDGVAKDRARMAEINRIGKEWDCPDDAQRAIEDGTSEADFRRAVMEKVHKTRAGGPSGQEIGMTPTEVKTYSLSRMVEAIVNGRCEKDAPFEFEVSKAIKERSGSGDSDRIAIMPEAFVRGSRAASQHRERAVFSLTGGAGNADAANIDPPEYHPEMFIDSLRETTPFLGMASMLGGLVGSAVTIPRELTNPAFYWVGEATEPTEGDYTLDQFTLAFKTMGAQIPFTRTAGKITLPNIDTLLSNSLRTGIGIELEKKAFNGGGTTDPQGIIGASGVGDVAGTAPTLALLLDLEQALGDANADTGRAVGFTNSRGKRLLLSTAKVASTDSVMLGSRVPGRNAVDTDIGTFEVTNNVPNDLQVGNDKSAYVYGIPAFYLFGFWGGVEFSRDTATHADTGSVVLRVFVDVDGDVTQAANWAQMDDIT